MLQLINYANLVPSFKIKIELFFYIIINALQYHS